MGEWNEEVRRYIANLNLEPAREAEIVEELGEHLAERNRELIADGWTPANARRRVLDELSEHETLQRELRRLERRTEPEPAVLGAGNGSHLIADLFQDLRYAARMIRKNPRFAAVAVLATAIGIGANTTIFSTADAMVIRPFLFPNQSRLVVLFERKMSIGITSAAVSPGNLVEWRTQSQTLQEVVAMRTREYTLTGDGSPERYTGYGVSASFFEALGVTPLIGRGFQAGDDEPGRAQVVVLRHAFWQNRFAGDLQIVGKDILLDGKPFTVVGVMPKDFDFPYGGGELWTPFVIDPQIKKEHRNHYLRVLALLKPGVSLEQANAELERIAKRIEEQYPDAEAGHSAYAVPMNEWYTRGVR
ncbi:MAG TPA: ABC transporter permease, partial [Blastocatellia bacterium]|nr:ABC transporter permease [Blastocatellia bacterium]